MKEIYKLYDNSTNTKSFGFHEDSVIIKNYSKYCKTTNSTVISLN